MFSFACKLHSGVSALILMQVEEKNLH